MIKYSLERIILLFQEVIEPLVGGEGLRISMRGLEYMNDDPSEVDVLYAQINMADGSDKLQVSYF